MLHPILSERNMSAKILVVEDEANLRETLRYNLKKEGYEVFSAVDGEQAVDAARREKPDLVLLDVMLPKLNGFEVCRILRMEMTCPVLMLTAKADETDKVVGLKIGADDYVTKPFSIKELMARIEALLRRTQISGIQSAGGGILKVGDIVIDSGRHRVSLKDAVIDLKPKEFDLLAFLGKNRGMVFSREQLLEKVWGYEFAGDSRTVDVHIRWLRQKIETDPGNPRHLITVRGTGYKLEG